MYCLLFTPRMQTLTRRDTLRALGVAGFAAASATTASAQSTPPGVAWRTRDADTPDLAGLVRLGDGYTYLGTVPAAGSEESSSVVLGRLDGTGEQVWRRTFDSPDGDLTATALTTDAGQYYACGVRTDAEGLPTPFVLALDSEGRERWRLDAAGDMATGVGRVGDSILVVGWRDAEERPIRPALSRYRPNGAELGRRIERREGIVPTDVVRTADGQYRLVGEQRRTDSPTLLFAADIDERAQFGEIQRFGYLSDVTVGEAVPVGETDTLVAGTLGGNRGLVVRLTPDGEKRWETILDSADTRLTAVDGGVRGSDGSADAPDAGVVVAGTRTTDGDDRPWAARVEGDGSLVWESAYGPSASNTATGVALGESGRFVLGGPTIVNSAWFVGADPTVSGTPTPTTTPTPTDTDSPTPTSTPTATPTPTGTTPPPGGSGGDLPLGLIGGAAVVGGAIALAGAAVLRRLGGSDDGGNGDAGGDDGGGAGGTGGADGAVGATEGIAVEPGDELEGGTESGTAAGDETATEETGADAGDTDETTGADDATGTADGSDTTDSDTTDSNTSDSDAADDSGFEFGDENR
jgi:hypothetical protein